jgi:hypothetical protein
MSGAPGAALYVAGAFAGRFTTDSTSLEVPESATLVFRLDKNGRTDWAITLERESKLLNLGTAPSGAPVLLRVLVDEGLTDDVRYPRESGLPSVTPLPLAASMLEATAFGGGDRWYYQQKKSGVASIVGMTEGKTLSWRKAFQMMVNWPRQISVDRDGRRIAVSGHPDSKPATLSVLNASGTLLWSADLNPRAVHELRFDARGNLWVVGRFDQELQLGDKVHRPFSLRSPSNGVAMSTFVAKYSDSGELIASAIVRGENHTLPGGLAFVASKGAVIAIEAQGLTHWEDSERRTPIPAGTWLIELDEHARLVELMRFFGSIRAPTNMLLTDSEGALWALIGRQRSAKFSSVALHSGHPRWECHVARLR